MRFDHRGQAALCAQMAGANRFVWNLFLAYNDRSYRVVRLARGYEQWTDFPEEHQPLLVNPGRAWQTMYKRFAAIGSGCFAREFQAFLQSPEGSADARPETLFATDPNPVPEKVYRIHRDRVQSSSASTTPSCTWA